MALINEIVINGFKAFPSQFKIELEGKNLLLYGENGSGKSSIYYALHCLFNSFRKPDKGKKYFDPNNRQNLINRTFSPQDEGDTPYVLINWKTGERSPFISMITKDGCDPTFARLAELDTCFINHQFLFSFFNFTNSKNANLFPIFEKEILPYIYDDNIGTYVSMMYEQIISVASKLGNKSSSKVLRKSIDIFNNKIDSIISDINLQVSDIYNNNFRWDNDAPLTISLEYPQVNPQPDVYFDGLRMKWDYPLIVNKNGNLVRANNKRIIEPIITISIMENGERVEKPHVYFNEAKLTAIALSIRFALLNLDNPAPGSFLALDDMLISLDMSNRAKVIDFLFKISNKYNIYLFTHDRVFFDYFKERIIYLNKAHGKPTFSSWMIKELYRDDIISASPFLMDSEDDIAKAWNHYRCFDYPACANYQRKALEILLSEVLPNKLMRQDNGDRHEKLRNTLDTAFSFLQKIPEFDLRDMSRLIGSLNLLLNPLSHKSTETNIYKTELKDIFAILDRLKLQIKSLKLVEVYARTSIMYMYFTEDEHTTQKFEIELKSELYVYEQDGVKHIYQPEAKSKRSCTITDGVEGDYNPNAHYKGNLEKICQDVHSRKGKVYANNYIDFYKDKDGTPLSSLT
ncbi:MAG: AAA family ATPase [Muribaculaceae bacterium]|nr:AAA family ATPase [Muribaculaceae bacterium]